MTTPDSKSRMSLKLLIDTKNQTVLFGEADKDFVDLLFSLMSLPLGTVISLLSSSGMVGCIGKVYQSIENLSRTYIQPNVDKQTLLGPMIAADDDHNNCGVVLDLLTLPKKEKVLPVGPKMYICPELARMRSSSNSYHRYVAQDSTATCPHCSNTMSTEATVVEASNKESGDRLGEGERGFVKGVVTYMVMDDLEVTPMSTISCIAVLNKFNIKDVGTLEEKTVSIGMDEVLKLLKASLQSKTALANVFLGGGTASVKESLQSKTCANVDTRMEFE